MGTSVNSTSSPRSAVPYVLKGGSADKFTADWQRVTRSFLTSFLFLVKKVQVTLRAFASPLPSREYKHSDQGKDTVAEIMDAYYLFLWKEKKRMPQLP